VLPSAAECEKLYDTLKGEKGAVELNIPAGKSISVVFVVSKGNCISWRLRVQKNDLSFAVRVREQGDNGAVEVDVYEARTIPYHEAVTGRIKACNQTKQYVLVFNNSYSRFTEKNCVYTVTIENDVFSEIYESKSAPDASSVPSSELTPKGSVSFGFSSVGIDIAQTPTSEKRKKVLKRLKVVSESSSCEDFSGWEAINELIDARVDVDLEHNSCEFESLKYSDLPDGEDVFTLADHEGSIDFAFVHNVKFCFKLESELSIPEELNMKLNTIEYFEKDVFYSIWMDLSELLVARITLVVYQDIKEGFCLFNFGL